MRIGILTYHRSHNYGALLQAYALKTYLISRGHDVEFIDYFPEYHRQSYANIKIPLLRRLALKYIIKYILSLFFYFLPLYIKKEIRRRKFIRFIKKFLIRKETGIKNTIYDVVIYGSDQIWRKQRQEPCPGFNDMYFGNELIKAKKRVAFSASMGIIDLNLENQSFLCQVFKRFAAISVREKDLKEAIKAFSTYPIEHTLDPVFLLDRYEWLRIASKKVFNRKYVLFYNLQGNKEAEEIVEYIGELLGLGIIELVIGVKQVNSRYTIKDMYGPREFISLIENAEYVISSSFHGVAFSILFQKQFYACLAENQGRVSSLLKILGIENRLISGTNDIDLSNSINYTQVMPILNRKRSRTINFLVHSIEN